MARHSPKSKDGNRKSRAANSFNYEDDHGDHIGGLPGQPNLKVAGGGVGSQGPRDIKGPGVEAKITGKIRGMGGKGGKK